MQVKFRMIHPEAKMPVYATSGSACFDFFSIENTEITKGSPKVLRTGIEMEIPEGYVMMLFSRSGHGFKNNIRLSNCTGIIDSDFRQEIKIKLIQDVNNTNESFKVLTNDRIGQGIILPYPQITFEEVYELSVTERKSGFGSTGR